MEDQTRRAVYGFLREAGNPVTREQVAQACAISRSLAAFHLDKLVEIGLAASGYDAVRRVHKVGRSPKLYRVTQREIQVSIPERQLAVLTDILLSAMADPNPGEAPLDAALRVADSHGHELGRSARSQLRGGRLGHERALALAQTTLRERGFEPYDAGPGCLRLRNCPFHAQAAHAPDLVCAINQRLLAGFLRGIGANNTQAVLDPREGECCVELCEARPRHASPPRPSPLQSSP